MRVNFYSPFYFWLVIIPMLNGRGIIEHPPYIKISYCLRRKVTYGNMI